MTDTQLCPCGSNHPFTECCGPIIDGNLKAPTAEALMRSRFSAFVLKDNQYLSSSWHPSTRPLDIDLEVDPLEWLGLSVIEITGGGEDDLEGTVKFRARFEQHGRPGELVEQSRFVREDGRWFYLDGEQPPSMKDVKRVKVGRNEPCPCGSGKKYKRCCGGY